MAWFKGTASDWHDMMDQLSNLGADEHISAVTIYDGGSGYAIGDTISLATGTYNHAPELEVRSTNGGDTVATVASIVAGGTGYAVGDTLTIDGGTYSLPCVLEVTAESAGVVTALQINDPGIYSVQPAGTLTTTALTGSGNDDLTVTVTWNTGVTGIVVTAFISDAGGATVTPTDPVATTSSGSGTGAKFELTWTETAWVTDMNFSPQEVTSAVVAAGGTGYSVSDIITVAGGTYTETATFSVATVSGSTVLTVTPVGTGYYSTTPSNPAATTSVAGGSGCTLTITWQDLANGTSTTAEKHMVLHNSNEDVYFGIRAYNLTANDSDVWHIFSLAGFNSISTKIWEQPGYDSNNCYVSLHDGSFSYQMSITDRKIMAIFNIGSGQVYSSMYAGLIDTFMTENEWPYPNLVMGAYSEQVKYTYSGLFGGMHNPGAIQSADLGPGRMSMPDGTFKTVRNWYAQSGNVVADGTKVNIQPCGAQYNTVTYAEDQWYYSAAERSVYEFIRWSDLDDITVEKIRRINDEYLLIPATMVDSTTDRLLGTLTDVYWFDNSDGVLTPGDRLWVNGVAYRTYPNGKLSNKNNIFCIKEA